MPSKIMVQNVIRIFLLAFLVSTSLATDEEKPEDSLTESQKAEALFRRLYKLERVEQLEAIKTLLKLSREDKQIKMVQAISDKVFSVLKKSRVILESSGFTPGVSSFPEDEKIREALSNILENTAFFGDILLRLPDITEEILRNHTDWNVLYSWSLNFTNQTQLVDSKTNTLIDLVSQELNYTKRHPNFYNPYRKLKAFKEPTLIEEPKKKAKKKKMLRGPRLTGVHSDEL